MEYQDKVLKCVDCGADFIFTSGEQLFFHDKQFKNEPRRCKTCKSKRAQALGLRALWGQPLEWKVREASVARAPSFDEGLLRLPPRAPKRLYAATVHHVAAHRRYSTLKFARGSLRPMQTAIAGLIEDARVEQFVEQHRVPAQVLGRPAGAAGDARHDLRRLADARGGAGDEDRCEACHALLPCSAQHIPGLGRGLADWVRMRGRRAAIW